MKFEGDSLVTSDDISYIFKLEGVQYLRLFDQGDAPVQMLQRIDEFSTKLSELDKISFNAHPHTYKQLNIRPLLEKFKWLINMYMIGQTLSDEQVNEFVQNQDVPSE